MRGKVNMSNVVEGGTFELLPDATYKVKITECAEKLTAGNQDPMFSITLEVCEGEYVDRKLWDNIIIPKEGSPAFKIMGRTKHFLHCIEEPYEGEIEYDTSRWLFKKVGVEVSNDTYKGKPKNIVQNYILDESSNPESTWEEESPL